LVNCHRYERPQRGRLREHWQLNVDIFGSDSVEAEIEIFDLVATMMERLGASPAVYELRVNDRILVEGALSNYVGVAADKLIDASMVLDRWHKVSDEARHQRLGELGLDARQIERLDALPQMDLDHYCEAAGDQATKASRLAQILEGGLSSAPIRFDPLIIRAFNYYTSTVFEVFDVSPDNPRSVFGGGRYDDLTGMFSKQRIPGIGFGMGDVTTWNFLDAHGLLPKSDIDPDVYLFATSEDYRRPLRELAREIRAAGQRVVTYYESVGMGNGMKRANRLGARYAVSFAEQEMATASVVLKDMGSGEQQVLPLEQVAERSASMSGTDI
jgi:histidyl-tRNA synthetase